MRDFRDAKVMARALRDALKAKAVETTHSESMELIAKAFGYENWNILSAKIEAAESPLSAQRSLSLSGTQVDPAPPKTLYCSFCGKSQHEVRKSRQARPPLKSQRARAVHPGRALPVLARRGGGPGRADHHPRRNAGFKLEGSAKSLSSMAPIGSTAAR
jgi:Glyoxalase superfamily protein/ClpX C4-type zinc finger